jgi:hypothetical protein
VSEIKKERNLCCDDADDSAGRDRSLSSSRLLLIA